MRATTRWDDLDHRSGHFCDDRVPDERLVWIINLYSLNRLPYLAFFTVVIVLNIFCRI